MPGEIAAPALQHANHLVRAKGADEPDYPPPLPNLDAFDSVVGIRFWRGRLFVSRSLMLTASLLHFFLSIFVAYSSLTELVCWNAAAQAR